MARIVVLAMFAVFSWNLINAAGRTVDVSSAPQASTETMLAMR